MPDSTGCCIVGGGPAGAVLSLLLARLKRFTPDPLAPSLAGAPTPHSVRSCYPGSAKARSSAGTPLPPIASTMYCLPPSM